MKQAVGRLFRERRGPIGPAALLLCALLFGGGGPHAPLPVALLEGFAFLLLVFHLVGQRFDRSFPPAAWAATTIAVAYLVCGGIQLVPLPADVWHSLPGRDLLGSAMTAAGWGGARWPASLSPQDTRSVLLAMLPPLTVFLLTATQPPRARLALARLAVGMAVLSALLGFLQLAAGDGSFLPYGLPPFTRLPGLFANFNHQATMLTGAFMLVVGIAVERPARDMPRKLGLGLVLGLLAIGTLITSSRAGLGLLAAAGAAGLLLWVSAAAARAAQSDRREPRQPRRRRLVAIGGGVTGIALVAFLFAGSYRADLMANRFGEAVDDLRFTFWVNTVQAIRAYAPIGSGLGTFDFVYQSVEPLNQIDGSFVNHAHNDYLELVLELGWAGVAVIVAAFAWTGWRLVVALTRPVLEPGVALARSGGVVLLLVMAHSIVDYPLRTEAVGCLFAFCAALLADRPEPEERRRHRSRVRQSGRTLVSVA